MRPPRRRRSRARPRPPTWATTPPVSWATRWEAERDAHQEQLARAASDDTTPDLTAHASQVAGHLSYLRRRASGFRLWRRGPMVLRIERV
jgi:hypothetical protein